MDVRCEKCQTEYELDEARLKPGGVTVKCTNCGHMFKIRKRTSTNMGSQAVPVASSSGASGAARATPPTPVPAPSREVKDTIRSRKDNPPRSPRPDSMFDESNNASDEAQTTVERQWLIRLENGEQKSCRELATLQQWIITSVVTRESLISRTGKTWKRLGDIADLGQYFAIADEARANRVKQASKSPVTSTLPGYTPAHAVGGTILPDDDSRPNLNRAGPTPPPVPPRGAVRPPPAGAVGPGGKSGPIANAATVPSTGPIAAPSGPIPSPAPSGPIPSPIPSGPIPSLHAAPAASPGSARVGRSTPTPPPPPPQKKPGTHSGPVALGGPPAIPPAALSPDGRHTAMWAKDEIKAEPSARTSGPFIGKLAAIPDEPAFAGRVRIAPSDEPTFESGKVTSIVEDDDDLLPGRRGSRTGMLVLAVALLVMGAAAAAIYVFVIAKDQEPVVATVKDAGVVAVEARDAQIVTDAAAAPVAEPAAVAAARGELGSDLEPRLRAAAQSLAGNSDPASEAMRAHVIARLAQDLQDRASLIADKTAADGLRKDARQLVLDAATAAQHALSAAADAPGANVAMAEVLRLQGKPAKDVARYLDTARAKPDAEWAREIALADALVLVRDAKLDEAKAALTAIDGGDGKLETSGDVRARLALALVLANQDHAADAKPLVETILAAQPEHAGAKALAARLETAVAKTDPLPPEEGTQAPPAPATPPAPVATRPPAAPAPTPAAPARPSTAPAAPSGGGGGGDSYDRLLARANAIADTSCTKAIELYGKALEQKPNGVEALAGMGYCHIDAKQFSSAFSKFRAALAVSSRYEPALRGIAEAYQQQGRKEQAIEAYKAYLEVYPNNAAAKRQLERLGGGAQPSEAPAAPPADPGAGAGSG